MHIAYVSQFWFGGGKESLAGFLHFAARKKSWRTFPLCLNESFKKSFFARLEKDGIDAYVGCLQGFEIVRPGLEHRKISLPHVILDNPAADCPCCMPDNRAIGKMAADHLLRLGYRTLAYADKASDASDVLHSEQRRLGFFDRSRAAGRTPILLHDDFVPDLQRLPKPIGIMAYNDITAMAVLDDCQRAKLKVPRQVGIIGVDDEMAICESVHPALSSIRPDFEGEGFAAGKALQALLKNRRSTACQVYGISRIVQRDSTCSMFSSGKLISQVQSILRNEFASDLTLDELSSRLGVSKNLLMRRFRECTGRTIHAELAEIRLDKAKALLSTTSMLVKEVAALCGYPSLEQFQRMYKRRFHETPGSCRTPTANAPR